MEKPQKRSLDLAQGITRAKENRAFNEAIALYDKYLEEREVDVDLIYECLDNAEGSFEEIGNWKTVCATALAEALKKGELWKS